MLVFLDRLFSLRLIFDAPWLIVVFEITKMQSLHFCLRMRSGVFLKYFVDSCSILGWASLVST